MNALFDRLIRFFEFLPDSLRKNRLIVWVTILVLISVMTVGMFRLKFDMALESWFQQDDPAVITYYAYRDSFGSDDSLYIVYKAKDGDVFSEASLSAVKGILEEIENTTMDLPEGEFSILEHILEVKSLINVSYMEVDGDNLNSRDFVGYDIVAAMKNKEKLRKEAMAHKDYPLFYVSGDSQYGGIFIRTDLGSKRIEKESAMEEDFSVSTTKKATETKVDQKIEYEKTELKEYSLFIDAINDIILKSKYSDVLDFYPVGNPVIMGFFHYVMEVEMAYIMLIAIIVMFLALLYLFRSLSAVVWPISIVILTTILTMGISGWLDIVMNLMMSIIIMLILVVGIADSVHIMSGYLYFRKNNHDHASALRAALKKSGFACMLTSFTTALGLLSMIFVPIPPIAVFAVSAAIGVVLAFILTIVMLPLMLDIWHPISQKQALKAKDQPKTTSLVQSFLGKIEPISHRYPVQIVLIFLVISIVSIIGLSRVKVNSNMVELVKESNPIRKAHELVDQVMGGTQSMEIFLDLKQQDALKDPAVLNAMEEMQKVLMEKHSFFVVKTDSLVNVVKNSYQVLNENREEMYIIPQDKPTLKQTLIMFDSANADDRRLLVTDDYSQGRISVRLKNFGSIEYLEFFNDVKQRSKSIFNPLKSQYPDMNVELTGALPLMMELVDHMSWSQVQSFSLALLVITITLLFVFGSPKLGLMAMIPNVLPVAVTFGTMGFLGIPLDADTLIIAPIVIGIAVDDTIHFLSHYRISVRETNNVIQSITSSINEVGQAITFSTIILVLGFFGLAFSEHLGMSRFGYLTAVAFISALLADLFLLPALCVLTAGKKTSEQVLKLSDEAQ